MDGESKKARKDSRVTARAVDMTRRAGPLCLFLQMKEVFGLDIHRRLPKGSCVSDNMSAMADIDNNGTVDDASASAQIFR